MDFCLPNYKPNFAQFFLPFEIFYSHIRSLPLHGDLEKIQQFIHNIAHKTYSNNKSDWFPFFKQTDFNILKKLSKNKSLVICRPDKGKGIVLLNRTDYIQKMEDVLSDDSKFTFVGSPNFSNIFKMEDKINRTLKQFKDKSMISDETYNTLYSSGSSYSILYGLPKVHKRDVPLRPILAAYNSPNFAIAKYLVPVLSKLTSNQHTLSNSSSFIPEILHQNSHSFMVSFDIQSLFTNIPLSETIDLIIDKLFPNNTERFNNFDKLSFRKLLELAVVDTHFIFNGNIYKQTDGMAMGSPLGPTFANIFMCHLEELILDQCPAEFKPLFYKRYVDDTFVLFREQSHAQMFLDFMNNFHRNIKFTMESECNGQLPFLDTLVSREDNRFVTGVFRKKTFTGLGMNYFSNCPLIFKINSCKTLLFRAFNLCSNWTKFHEEVTFLKQYFKCNCFPSILFDKIVRNFIDSVFRPKLEIPTVPKKLMYISLPYVSDSIKLKRELTNFLMKVYPYVDFKFIFKNPLTIGSIFSFKDSLPELMRSCIIYEFNCPKCNFGKYIGCTKRLLKVRINSHMGVSYRTGCALSVKENSAIRDHANKCHHSMQYDDFKLLAQAPNQFSLPFLESISI